MKMIFHETIDPREYWEREDSNFTPWLAENIDKLSSKIGIELEVEAQEKNVGPFRADILCRDVNTDKYVLIENQLEKTDHSHLGQVITYAAGLEATTMIWIAKEFTEEHRAAIDWLNSFTDEKFNFFGIEIELLKMDNDLVTPYLNIIARPNDWTKQARHQEDNSKLKGAKLLQLKFWTGFKEYMEGNSKIRIGKPAPQHWNSCAIGRSGFHVNATVDTQDMTLGVELVIEKDSEIYFAALQKYEDDSKIKISPDIFWDKKEGRKYALIKLRKEFELYNENLRQEHFLWLKNNMESFINFFKPLIKEL